MSARARPGAADVATMAEVRAAVDSIDSALVALLAERMSYMDAAARIKPRRELVRDEARKADVLAHVTSLAAAHGLDPDIVRKLWELLVEASIAHELAAWDRAHAAPEGRQEGRAVVEGARQDP